MASPVRIGPVEGLKRSARAPERCQPRGMSECGLALPLMSMPNGGSLFAASSAGFSPCRMMKICCGGGGVVVMRLLRALSWLWRFGCPQVWSLSWCRGRCCDVLWCAVGVRLGNEPRGEVGVDLLCGPTADDGHGQRRYLRLCLAEFGCVG